jgi:hypothetical protein
MRGHCEGEPHVHPTGIIFDGCIEEFFRFGEGDDLIEFAFDFRFSHAEDGAVEIDIFAAGQFGMKPGADFEERSDAASELRRAFSGLGDSAEDFQERRFSRAVAADDSYHFAALDFERDVLQGPEFSFGGAVRRGGRRAGGTALLMADMIVSRSVSYFSARRPI